MYKCSTCGVNVLFGNISLGITEQHADGTITKHERVCHSCSRRIAERNMVYKMVELFGHMHPTRVVAMRQEYRKNTELGVQP